jgi:aspartate--ammonia ligase
MFQLQIPKNYDHPLDIRETEIAIKFIKDFFEHDLSKQLNLTRVSAPLFVRRNTGLNDDLNGIERPVAFEVRSLDDHVVEVVHSLAKWKRMALKRYGFKIGEGLYTDMNAIRRDEETDNLHSIYVDQWDWEKNIAQSDRTIDTLIITVKHIYDVMKDTEIAIYQRYPMLKPILPQEIYFISTQELEDRWPDKTPKDREDAICFEKKAVFIMQIGDLLKSGIKHDGRAPDYDDWSLNGDIVVYNPILDRSFELSSMGIRVDEKSLDEQLTKAKADNRRSFPFHKDLLEGRLPYSMGGGIGQSRLCMFFLKKAHIGEVQASVWSDELDEACSKAKIKLL